MSEERITKQSFIDALRWFAEDEAEPRKGQGVFAQYLVYFLQVRTIPHHPTEGIRNKIPELVLIATKQFLADETSFAVQLREEFNRQAGFRFPNITNIYRSFESEADRYATLVLIADLVVKVTGWPELGWRTEQILDPEAQLAKQRFCMFVEYVWRGGLRDVMDFLNSESVSGKFGDTELTVTQTPDGLDVSFGRYFGVHPSSVSFLLSDDDAEGYGSRLRDCKAILVQVLEMIEDVTRGWPRDKAAQAAKIKAEEPIVTS